MLVDVAGQVLRDEAVEQHPQNVGLEIPAIDAAAQIVGDPPDSLVQLGALGFLVVVHEAEAPVACLVFAIFVCVVHIEKGRLAVVTGSVRWLSY